MSFELRHFDTVPFRDPEWRYLEFGHDAYDSRCMGGAWYYKGDKEKALEELAKIKAKQAELANSYYSQKWV